MLIYRALSIRYLPVIVEVGSPNIRDSGRLGNSVVHKDPIRVIESLFRSGSIGDGEIFSFIRNYGRSQPDVLATTPEGASAVLRRADHVQAGQEVGAARCMLGRRAKGNDGWSIVGEKNGRRSFWSEIKSKNDQMCLRSR